MRLFALIAALVGNACSFQTVAAPCGPGGSCPEGMVCLSGVDRCVSADRAPDSSVDAGEADAQGDGPVGEGPWVDGRTGDARGSDLTPSDAAGDGAAGDGAAGDLGPTYSWQYGDWTDCSPCWGGDKTREAWCERDDGTQVEDAHCDAGSKEITTDTCPTPTEVCYWWRATDNCIHLYGKCATGPDEWFLDWDCCSTAAPSCDLPGEDCQNAIGNHRGTCHADNTCGGYLGQDYKYPD